MNLSIILIASIILFMLLVLLPKKMHIRTADYIAQQLNEYRLAYGKFIERAYFETPNCLSV